jgi:hypothetical protein
MEQCEVLYESPILIEVGNFTELTRGFGSTEFDAFDLFSDFFFEG